MFEQRTMRPVTERQDMNFEHIDFELAMKLLKYKQIRMDKFWK